MRHITILAAFVAIATPTLAGCVTGVDSETKRALRETLDSVQELTDLWEERLNDLDEGGSEPPVEPPAEPPTVREPATGSGAVTLIGSNRKTGTETFDENSFDLAHFGRFSGTRDTWSYSSWGVRGTDGGSQLFTATISGTNLGLDTTLIDPYSTLVTGLYEFDNPVGYGTATWTGKVRAYETHPNTFGTPVGGDARLQMDLDSILETIDVDFTNFDRGHANMGWNSVFVSLGGFRSFLYGELEGKFYGNGHEGAAGTFERDGLKGVFGAVRE